MSSRDEAAVRARYEHLLEAWNTRNAEAYAASFTQDGSAIGFDGSQHHGRATVAAEIGAIFASHQTGRYIGIVRAVQFPAPDVAILRAVAGIVPSGQTDINPAANSIQGLVAVRHGDEWQIALFQNTPAQFHGRPELAQQLTEELRRFLA
jgi:uncharacterized protein (TIGR02246 family)